MATVNHQFINTNGITMHVAEQGQGPLVILCHGFPEFWYSWRHQLPALAEAGYHVVAPDQRGYGQTDRPDTLEARPFQNGGKLKPESADKKRMKSISLNVHRPYSAFW